ncbi:MAG: tripartite tricarboxylate transporter substrate binding protein [Usitatibacter sp.]
MGTRDEMILRACRTALAVASIFFAGCAMAQAWPAKTIRWIVPFAPGGANDITARSIAERLTAALGQPVVIENKSGAGGTIGMEFVAKSAPDGYTVLSSSDTITLAPHLYPNIGFHPLRDFAAVTQLGRMPVVIAAHPSLGVRSLAELIVLAKARPGLGYGTAGAGSQQHLAAEWFAKSAGIELTHIPYKGGAQAVMDFVGGQVPLAVTGAAPLMAYYKSGRVQLLAQTTRTRSPNLPAIPTLVELGFSQVVIEQWQGVFLPAKTPKEIVARLNAEIVKALADPKVREFFSQNGLEPVGSSPAEFAEAVRIDYEKYGKLVRELRVKID